MTKREIMKTAHEVRKATGCSMSLALRQVYATRRAMGFAIGASERKTDIGQWLVSMVRKDVHDPSVLAAYDIPAV